MIPRLLSTVLVLFLLLETVYAVPVFLENVSESGGWYDCNKKTKWTWGTKPDPNNSLNPPVSARPLEYYNLPMDDQLCWAAAASNVLQWWQDTRSDLAPTTPNGKSATYGVMHQLPSFSKRVLILPAEMCRIGKRTVQENMNCSNVPQCGYL